MNAVAKSQREQIMAFELYLKTLPQPNIVTRHCFADHLYAREIAIPADCVLTGMIHKFEHINIVSKGHIRVWTEDMGWRDIKAPATFISKPGTKRLGITVEETVWTTIHVNENNETDIEKIEQALVTNDYDEADRFLIQQEAIRLKGGQCHSG